MSNEKIVDIEPEKMESKQNITKEKYKFFNYFKEHPAFFVTMISFTLAVVTFLCNFLNTTVIRIYLQRWNFGTSLIGPSIRNDTFYYYAIFSLIYFFVLCVLSDNLKSVYSDFFCELVFLNYCREIKRIFQKSLRKQKKDLRHIRRKKRWNRSFDEKEVRRLEKKISKDSKSLEETQQSIHKLRIALIKGMARRLLLCLLLLFIPSSLQLLSFGRISFQAIVMAWGIYSLSFVLPVRYFSKQIYHDYSRERIVSDINKASDNNQFEEFCKSLSESISEKKPQKEELFERFSDKNIPNIITEALTGIVFMIVTVLITGVLLLNTDLFNTNITCYTCSSDGKNYAVIYQNESLFYLEEAEEVDGNLIIDTSSQRILKTDNLSLNLKKYDKVIKRDYLKTR